MEDNIVLYHESTWEVQFPEIRKSTYNKDFYFGFYCTIYENQAIRWATRFGKPGVISVFSFHNCDEIKILTFPEMTEEWLDFIDGKISKAAFWELAKFKHPTHQVSFHSIRALDTLKFERSYVADEQKK